MVLIRRSILLAAFLIPWPDSARSNALSLFMADSTESTLSVQIHRFVIGNPVFYEFYRHRRMRSGFELENETMGDYESIETTISAQFQYKDFSIRASLPYQVVRFSNLDIDRETKEIGTERKDHQNRGIGDFSAMVTVPLPLVTGWASLVRVFPTGQSVYNRDQPHLGTGLGISTWEPGLGYRLSFWIFEAELEGFWVIAGSKELRNFYFLDNLDGATITNFPNYGKARASILARLYRDKDHEVTLKATFMGITGFEERIDLTPQIPDFNFKTFGGTVFEGSQTGVLELGVRFGKEFRMGIRALFYPLLLHQGNFSILETGMDLSLTYGII